MRTQSANGAAQDRIDTSLPFVRAMARRMASSMPHSIDISDLVQDGMIGLMDAAHRFDASRGIKFETFAERRVRGAMIDALRRDAWPRGVRRQRREIEAAREKLRHELGSEPSLSDLAAYLGADPVSLGRTITRINTIEATSPLTIPDVVDEANLPAVMVPSEPPAPDEDYEQHEVQDRVRAAIAALPPRERKVVGMYYYGESTMKEIGLGDRRERVARIPAACACGAPPPQAAGTGSAGAGPSARPLSRPVAGRHGTSSRMTRISSRSRNGFASQRHPLSSRNRAASVPATSPVTNTMRRARLGVVFAISR